MDNQSEIIMGLIANGGNARSLAMKAMYAAKAGNFEEAQELLKASNESILKAHNMQTQLLTNEAGGQKSEVSLLMVHAQDHLMNAMTVKDLATEIVDIYKNQRGEA
ncbi:MAG: cellobiose system component [Enterococcus sp.]|uniref:PTS lactose/cellobiose transporter subunit IIA n=1 Tax=Enterococcus sp. TaxID=35783 RepID=UPI0025909A64|nr:PTS lactose/cellobiose transporter subunit IIA [Enterococcus sp.]MDK2845087.1 cellobiose system component [Enterococcus sp.]